LVKDPQQARQALHPWKELASRTGVTVLLSGHTNRDTSSNVRNVYGMTGELRKARMTILAQTDPDDDGVLVIGPEKSNVAAPVPASRFRIESVQVFPRTEDSDGTVPRLVWIGDAEQSAREMFTTAADTSEQGGSQPIDRWLRASVTDAGGGCKAADVYEAGEGEGYTEDQLKRAKRRCRIVAERPVNPGPWYWMLPAKPDATDG